MSYSRIHLGIFAAPLLFFSVVFFGILEPGYSHLENSVSSLGAISAQNTLIFNIFGLFLPGIFIAISFSAQYKALGHNQIDKAIYLSMIVFGLMFSGLALPMDLPPVAFAGVTMHYVLAYSTVIPFLFSALLYAHRQRKQLAKKPWALILPLGFILIDIAGKWDVPSGLLQRGLLACIFLWVALLCQHNIHMIRAAS